MKANPLTTSDHASNAAAAPLQPGVVTCWHRMIVKLPAQWAIVRHGVKESAGRLVWIDRRDQRMQLAWAHSATRPDIARAMTDYRSLDLQDDANATFKDLPALQGWMGLVTYSRLRTVTRAVRYEPQLERWIEVVLNWPGQQRDESLEQDILLNFSIDPMTQGAQDWQAFGVKLTVTPAAHQPHPCVLKQVTPLPADVRWQFHQPATKSQWTLRKAGMLETWFDGSAEDLLRRQHAGQKLEIQRVFMQGHEAFLGITAVPQARITRLWRRKKQCLDVVWHCPESKAVWQATYVGDAPVESSPWQAIIAHCCGSHGHAEFTGARS
jgi:hypothetical protein